MTKCSPNSFDGLKNLFKSLRTVVFLLVVIFLVVLCFFSYYPDIYVYVAKKHVEIANDKQADLITKTPVKIVNDKQADPLTKNPVEIASDKQDGLIAKEPNSSVKTDIVKYTSIGEMGDSFGPVNALFTFLSVTILIIGLVLQSRELNQATQAQKKINETSQLNMAVEVIVDTLNHLGDEDVYKSIKALNDLPDKYCEKNADGNGCLKRFDEAYKEYLVQRNNSETKKHNSQLHLPISNNNNSLSVKENEFWQEVSEHIRSLLLPFEKVYLLFEENKGIFDTELIPRLFRSYEVTRAFLYIAMPIHAQESERFDKELFIYFLRHFEKHQNTYLDPYIKLVNSLDKESVSKIDNEFGKNELEMVQMTIEALKNVVESKIDFKGEEELKKNTLSNIYYQLSQIGLLRHFKEGGSDEDKKDKLKTVIGYCEKAVFYNLNNPRIFNSHGNAKSFLADLECDDSEKNTIIKEAIEQFKKATEIDKKYAAAWYNCGLAYNRLAMIERDTDKKRELTQEAIEKYKKSTECDESHLKAWYNWGVAIGQLAEFEKDREKKKKLINEAIEKYKKSTECDENYSFAWGNWGFAIGKLAGLEEDREKKKKLINEAIEKYQKLTECDSNYVSGWHGWGFAIGKLAGLEEDREKKKKLINEAIEKYKKTTECDSNYADGWYNWGVDIGALADLEEDREKRKKLINEAIGKYKKSTECDENYSFAWCNWGFAIGQLAGLEEDREKKKKLINEAIEKYKKSTECDESHLKAWYNWGLAIGKLAGLEEDREKKKKLIKEEIEKYEKALECDPSNDVASSNLEAANLEYENLNNNS